MSGTGEGSLALSAMGRHSMGGGGGVSFFSLSGMWMTSGGQRHCLEVRRQREASRVRPSVATWEAGHGPWEAMGQTGRGGAATPFSPLHNRRPCIEIKGCMGLEEWPLKVG